MTEITTLLSPGGETITRGGGPATRILVGTVEGVASVERAGPGAPWSVAGRSLTDRHVGSLARAPRSGKLFAGAHGEDGGLWVSDDGAGASWREVTEGLDRRHVYSLAVRARDDDVTLFLGTQPAALYRSDDLGESWSELPSLRGVRGTEEWTFPAPPHVAHVKSIVFHPREPKTLFALVEQGALLKSVDDGVSWTELSDYSRPDDDVYRDVHRMAFHPDDPDVLYLATGVGMYRSGDGGRSFERLTGRKDRIGYPDHVFFHPHDHGRVFVAGGGTNPGRWRTDGIAYAAVECTRDDGRTWRALDGGLPSPVRGAFDAMSLHSWDGGMMLAIGTCTGEVYVSEDDGASWTLAVQGLAPVSKDGHYRAFVAAA